MTPAYREVNCQSCRTAGVSPGGAAGSSPGREPWVDDTQQTSSPGGATECVAPPGLKIEEMTATQGSRPGLLTAAPPGLTPFRRPITPTRRQFLVAATAAAIPCATGVSPVLGVAHGRDARGTPERQALIAITLDLEMCRNFPKWEDTHWDYDKGNLTDETKRYAVEACRRIKAAGGVAHLFVVGRALEQA